MPEEEEFTVPVSRTDDLGAPPERTQDRKSSFSVRRPYQAEKAPDALIEQGDPSKPPPASGRSSGADEP